MALGLVGKTGRVQIWVEVLSVMSKKAPIPPATGHPTKSSSLLHKVSADS